MMTPTTSQTIERHNIFYTEAAGFLKDRLEKQYGVDGPIENKSTLDELGLDSLDRLELDTEIYKRYPVLERHDADYKYSGLDRLVGSATIDQIADAVAYSINRIRHK